LSRFIYWLGELSVSFFKVFSALGIVPIVFGSQLCPKGAILFVLSFAKAINISTESHFYLLLVLQKQLTLRA
jgi:hypothetical protein